MPREHQKEMDKRNVRNIKPSDFSGIHFRSDKIHFLVNPSWRLSLGPCGPCLPLPHGWRLCPATAEWPPGILVSSLLSSKDLTSTFQVSWSQIFLWGTLLIHRQLELCDEGQRVVPCSQFRCLPLGSSLRILTQVRCSPYRKSVQS